MTDTPRLSPEAQAALDAARRITTEPLTNSDLVAANAQFGPLDETVVKLAAERDRWMAVSEGAVKEQFRLQTEANMWKERWTAERRDHEATIKHYDDILNDPHS